MNEEYLQQERLLAARPLVVHVTEKGKPGGGVIVCRSVSELLQAIYESVGRGAILVDELIWTPGEGEGR